MAMPKSVIASLVDTIKRVESQLKQQCDYLIKKFIQMDMPKSVSQSRSILSRVESQLKQQCDYLIKKFIQMDMPKSVSQSCPKSWS